MLVERLFVVFHHSWNIPWAGWGWCGGQTMAVLSRSWLLFLDLQIVPNAEAQIMSLRAFRTGSEEVLQMSWLSSQILLASKTAQTRPKKAHWNQGLWVQNLWGRSYRHSNTHEGTYTNYLHKIGIDWRVNKSRLISRLLILINGDTFCFHNLWAWFC